MTQLKNNHYAALAGEENDVDNDTKIIAVENDGEITGVRHDNKTTGVDSNNDSIESGSMGATDEAY